MQPGIVRSQVLRKPDVQAPGEDEAIGLTSVNPGRYCRAAGP